MSDMPGVGSWIERRARIAPEHVALVHGDVRWSYAQLADRIARLATGLRGMGVALGDRVVWLGDNHPAFLEVFFAAARLGAILAPVNHRLPPDVIGRLVGDYDARLAIVGPGAAGIELPAGLRIVVVDGRPDGAYEALITGSAPAAVEPVGFDDVCLMPHTSGTTGAPKGVMLTHGNLTWNALNMLAVADLRPDDVTPALAPMFRTGGTGVNVLPVLLRGGTVVVPERATPDDLLALFAAERVTVGFGNPDLLDALTRSESWASADLSSIRFVITGGAPVPERLIRAYGARDVVFLQGYGLSEASPVVSVLDNASAASRVGAAGRPLPFVDVRVTSHGGEECAPFVTGELSVRGPTIMRGYWRRDEATRATIDGDGWLRTGDAAHLDDEGFLWIVGRMEDAFTVDGWVVHPGDVERCIGGVAGVAEVGVVQVDDRVFAFVVAAPGARVTPVQVLDHCAARLDAREVPATVDVVDTLPRTTVGKLDRGALREQARSACR